MISYAHVIYSETGMWLPDDSRSSPIYALVQFGIAVTALAVGFAVGSWLWWKGHRLR